MRLLSIKEVGPVLITVLIMAFLLSFRHWGGLVFDVVVGITNFAIAFVIGLLVLIIKIYTQKRMASKKNYDYHYEFSKYGLLFGILLAIPSFGFLLLITPGTFNLTLPSRKRMGRIYKGVLLKDRAKIVIRGIFSTILFAIFLKFLFNLTGASSIKFALFVTLTIAVYSLLPLPKNDGIHLFFYSRTKYIFWLTLTLMFSIGFYFLTFWQAILPAIIFAIGLSIFLNKN